MFPTQWFTIQNNSNFRITAVWYKKAIKDCPAFCYKHTIYFGIPKCVGYHPFPQRFFVCLYTLWNIDRSLLKCIKVLKEKRLQSIHAYRHWSTNTTTAVAFHLKKNNFITLISLLFTNWYLKTPQQFMHSLQLNSSLTQILVFSTVQWKQWFLCEQVSDKGVVQICKGMGADLTDPVPWWKPV